MRPRETNLLCQIIRQQIQQVPIPLLVQEGLINKFRVGVALACIGDGEVEVQRCVLLAFLLENECVCEERGWNVLPLRPVCRQSYTSSSSSFFLTATMTRLVRSQYISTLCFWSIASFAASALPGSTTPVERGLAALPGTLVSGCVEERAAASLVLRVVFSFCAVLSESASFLFSAVRVVFVFVRAAMDLLREVSSDVRDCKSATCCLRALMTASWSAERLVGSCGKGE